MNLKVRTIFLGLLCTINSHATDFKPVQAEIKTLFDNILLEDDIYNASMAIFSPSKNIDWRFVGGQFSTGENLIQNNPFHGASIGKTFTATAVLMLYEQNHLELQDKIAKYLTNEVMSGLHRFDGKDYSNEITIKQLLQHTSGLPDYFVDDTTDSLPNGMSLLFAQTGRIWSPEELVNISKMSMKPHFIPGTSYRYTDTGYILLGLIVEHISGLLLHDFFQKHIFAPLDMNNTYMHLRAKPSFTAGEMADLYANNIEISSFKSLSLDWAGGGIASTAHDLNKFQIALHSRQLLSLETLTKMKQWVPESKGIYYGLGLRKISAEELVASESDLNLVGHTGSTSSFMFFCPELDVYLSGTFNQINKVGLSTKVPINILNHIQRQMKSEE